MPFYELFPRLLSARSSASPYKVASPGSHFCHIL